MAATLVCSALLAGQAQGQSTAATITEILDSNQVFIQNQVARVNSVAQQRQQVRTQAARAALRFNTGAVARLAHNSSLVVGHCAQINRGTMLVNGTLNGCSTSTVAGVRGTIYTIEVTALGETIIQVFEGEVVAKRNLDPLSDNTPADDTPAEGFDPLDPSQDPLVPGPDPVVPFVNPIEQPTPAIDPPTGPIEPFPESLFEPTEPNLGSEFTSLVAANKQQEPAASTPEITAPAGGETVEFAAEDTITLAEGQQLIIDAKANTAVIASLGPEDFIRLLEGPLISGFTAELPGMGNLRRSFEQLFPGVPLPSFWLPTIPSPSIRFPFPF